MQSSNSKTTVIICDDHPIFRHGLMRIIERDESLEIVGECGDGDSALELIKKIKPDVYSFLTCSCNNETCMNLVRQFVFQVDRLPYVE